MTQFLSGQCYGFSKNFENFYPDRDMGSKGTFRGPAKPQGQTRCLRYVICIGEMMAAKFRRWLQGNFVRRMPVSALTTRDEEFRGAANTETVSRYMWVGHSRWLLDLG
ncbi:hypothetical protein BYT27DRAFT_7201876 [Phlegmacium glaucopus]|nr:hypothetical protein BYT27DRAFT_7201876 [Phlegmacium glaucopus]